MYKLLFTGIFLYLLFFVTTAQSQDVTMVDSLNRQIEIAKHDTSRVMLLAEISRQYLYYNPDTAVAIGQTGYNIADSIGFVKGEAACLNAIGNGYWVQRNYPKALDYLLNGLKAAETSKYKIGMSRCYNNIGNIYWAQEKYPLALEYYQ